MAVHLKAGFGWHLAEWVLMANGLGLLVWFMLSEAGGQHPTADWPGIAQWATALVVAAAIMGPVKGRIDRRRN